ncbi:MAG TPA: PAS domain S-box protein [Bryobacteraceae bacterium]|nr:PAS domain S-box protein [Bryobacteraceae bacterium]
MRLESNPEIYRTVLENVPVGVYLVDQERRIVFWNRAAEEITGYLGQEVIGRFCHDNILMHCDRDSNILCGSGCPLARTIADGRLRQTDVFLRHKEGQRIAVEVRAMPVRDESGAIVGSAEFFSRRPYVAEGTGGGRRDVRHARDAITDLPDRDAMLEAVRDAIQEFGTSQRKFGILRAAVDDMERLRLSDGYQAVNAVMYAAGQTIAGGIRPSDTAGMWREGGFMVVVSCDYGGALAACAGRLQSLVKMAAVPWWGDRLSVTVSMGGAMVEPDDTAESLVERASRALEAGRAQGPDSLLVI